MIPIARCGLMVLVVCPISPAQLYTVSTIAGGAPFATPARAVPTPISPQGIARDASENIYFTSGNCVFRVERSGNLTRIAGSSRAGYSGDGGPALAAQLNAPQGLALDRAGNLVIADTGNFRVRKVSGDGVITTIAGSGVSGSAGDGGPAVNAQLHVPDTIAIDSQGNLFIGDGNFAGVSTLPSPSRVRRVGLDGIINEVVAARMTTGGAGIALDSNDNLYIASAGPSVVVRISPSGTVEKIAGGGVGSDGGLATQARLIRPHRVAVDTDGSFFIGDFGQIPQGGYYPALRRVSADGVITTVAGGGQITDDVAFRVYPAALAPSGAHGVLVADQFGIIEFRQDNSRMTVAGTETRFIRPLGDGGLATNAILGIDGNYNLAPHSLAIDGEGNLFIAEKSAGRVRKVTPEGIISTVAGIGGPRVGVNPDPALPREAASPSGLWFDSSGNLYIWDGGMISKLTPQGAISTVLSFGSFLYSVNAVAVDFAGNIFLTDSRRFVVHRIAPDGVDTVIAGNGRQGDTGDGGPAIGASLDDIQELTVDAAGSLYIVANRRVRRVSANGIISTVRGTEDVGWGIAVDTSGSVYANFNSQVRRVSANGTVETVAGTDHPGYSGDGGPAIAAKMRSPHGIAVNASGDIYVADVGNNAVRRLRPSNNYLMVSAVVDAASETAISLAPGKIIAIYGAGFDPVGSNVQVNGIAARVLYSTPIQIGAVVPYGIGGTTASLVVTAFGQTSVPFVSTTQAISPSVFTSNQTGSGQAAAVNLDGSLNSAVNPVAVGSYISLYCTGEGQTIPAGVDGKPASSPLPRPVLPVAATIDGRSAVVQYAGGAPGLIAGLMQVNVQIPTGVQAGGYVLVIVRVGDAESQPGVTIAVSN